jgi:phosphohistidine phosphatase
VKRLWLLRHAKSSWDDPGLADHDRPLAPRGLKAAERIARWTSDNDVRPDLVLCSTALRARATLDLVVRALDDPEIEFDDALYHASAAELLVRLRTVRVGLTEVLLVGHNPGLLDLVGLLAPPAPDAFPTGALAELRLAIATWVEMSPGCAHLEELLVPRSLPR